jgi:hypothetical protein
MLKPSLILSILFFASILNGQSPAKFSGTWEFDKLASSPDLIESKYDGTVIRQITQNPSTISFKDTWKKEGNPDFTTSAETYTLDGKERIKKDDIGTRKNSARWSEDKKVLTITNCDTQKLKGKLQDFLVTESYRLSENGQTVIIERYSKNPVTGETTAKKVYHKK